MLAILGITFPIFAAIGLGFGFVRFGLFKPADMRAFGSFVMQVALPALIFTAVAKRDIADVFNLPYMAAYTLGGLATMAIAYVWFSFATDKSRRALAVMGSACPNSVLVGFPLMLMVFPDLAGLILAMNFLVENVIFIPVALALVEMTKGGNRSLLAQMGGVIWGVLKRPMVIGLFLGLGVSISGLTIPAPLFRLLDMFAVSAAALSLVVIGGSLSGIPIRGNLGLAGQVAVAKLILHPIITVGAIALLATFGFALTGDLRVALILSAAVSIFGIYTVLAQEAGHAGFASLALLLSTLGSFMTLNLLLLMMV